MSIVGDLVDRTVRAWLEPPDELWTRTRLTSAVDSSTQTWPIDTDLLTAEEQSLLGPGVLIEAGSEQVQVVDLSGSSLTVRRGARGTSAASHAEEVEVVVKPPYTRVAIFDAVADTIVGLNPPLFTFGHETVEVGTGGITQIDADAVTIMEARWLEHDSMVSFVDLGQYPDPTDESSDPALIRAVRMFGIDSGEEVFLSYRGRFPRPTSEAQDLSDLGVEEQWGRLVTTGAAAQLVASRPLSVAQQEFVSGQLRTEGYPVETPGRVRDGLIRYHEYLLEKASQNLLRQHPPTLGGGPW